MSLPVFVLVFILHLLGTLLYSPLKTLSHNISVRHIDKGGLPRMYQFMVKFSGWMCSFVETGPSHHHFR